MAVPKMPVTGWVVVGGNEGPGSGGSGRGGDGEMMGPGNSAKRQLCPNRLCRHYTDFIGCRGDRQPEGFGVHELGHGVCRWAFMVRCALGGFPLYVVGPARITDCPSIANCKSQIANENRASSAPSEPPIAGEPAPPEGARVPPGGETPTPPGLPACAPTPAHRGDAENAENGNSQKAETDQGAGSLHQPPRATEVSAIARPWSLFPLAPDARGATDFAALPLDGAEVCPPTPAPRWLRRLWRAFIGRPSPAPAEHHRAYLLYALACGLAVAWWIISLMR